MLDFLVCRSFDRRFFRVVGTDDEAAAGLGLDVEVELEFLVFGREFYAREFRSQGGADVCLNLLLELEPRWRFKRRNAGITGVRDESAFRFGLDAVDKLRYYALEFHDALRDCSAIG